MPTQSVKLHSKISQYVKEGLSVPEMAKELGVHPATLWRRADELGIPVRHHRKANRAVLDSAREDVLMLWGEGQSVTEIARQFEVSRGMVKAWLLRNGQTPTKRPAHGASAGRWAGGHSITSQGYKLVSVPDNDAARAMTTKKGYVLEHRLVMARHIGRLLKAGEQVHHINGNKLDNCIENLQLRHAHGPGQAYQCNKCGSNDVSPRALDGD